jgi:plasmid stabilization system protein ParE
MRFTEFHPEAELEMEEAHGWYEQERPGLGDQFADIIRDSLSQIRENPDRFPVVRGDIRRSYPCKPFPFKILYRVRSSKIIVMAIAHQSRKPGYWKNRKP